MPRLTLIGFLAIALLVSTRARALDTGPRSTQTYDIRLLLVQNPDFQIPRDSGSAQIGDGKKAPVLTRAQLTEQLVDWLGAAVGSAAELSVSDSEGKLMVTADADTQRHVARLLSQVEARRAVQVTVQIRELIFASYPQLKRELADKISLATGPAGRPVEITEDDVQQLFRELQKSSASSIITAPRMTLFDGQRGFVDVSRTKPYLGAYGQREVNGEREAVPVEMNADSGIAVRVRPSVDADHVHVAIDLQYDCKSIVEMRPEPTANAPPGQNAVVQVPIIEEVRADRTLSTSSGRTLLSGLEPAAHKRGQLRFLLITPSVIVPGKAIPGSENQGDQAEHPKE